MNTPFKFLIENQALLRNRLETIIRKDLGSLIELAKVINITHTTLMAFLLQRKPADLITLCKIEKYIIMRESSIADEN